MSSCKICKRKTHHDPHTKGAWMATDGWKYVANNAPTCLECESYYTEEEIEEKLNKVSEEK